MVPGRKQRDIQEETNNLARSIAEPVETRHCPMRRRTAERAKEGYLVGVGCRFLKPLSKKLRNPLDQEQIMRKDNTSDISPITSFREQHFFLSNFYACTINFEGITYPSTEHAYQAAKSVIIAERQLICRQSSAGNAKRAGRRITIRRDWNDVKLAKMEAILRLKFNVTQPELVQKLTATHPRILREENYWHDTFWGICNGAGSNHLGKLLMKIRADLQRA